MPRFASPDPASPLMPQQQPVWRMERNVPNTHGSRSSQLLRVCRHCHPDRLFFIALLIYLYLFCPALRLYLVMLSFRLFVICFRFVVSDNDYGLFTVTVFRKIAQDFKTVAREKKYCVHFPLLAKRFPHQGLLSAISSFSPRTSSPRRPRRRPCKVIFPRSWLVLSSLFSHKCCLLRRGEQLNSLWQNASLAWCKTAFSESFSAFIHVKVEIVNRVFIFRYASDISLFILSLVLSFCSHLPQVLRVFVESVLR